MLGKFSTYLHMDLHMVLYFEAKSLCYKKLSLPFKKFQTSIRLQISEQIASD